MSVRDIEAGSAWVEVSARTGKLEQALAKADKTIRGFSDQAKRQMSALGGQITAGFGKSLLGVTVALGAAKKAFDSLGSAAGRAMDNLRTAGTDEQKEAMARLDQAVQSLRTTFMDMVESVVGKVAGPVATAIEKMQSLWDGIGSIIDQLKQRFSGFLEVVSKVANSVSELWDRGVNAVISRSPTLAKAASDALVAAGERAMDSWSADNALFAELDRINDKVNKTADDIARENAIVAQLKSRWGDVGLSVDQVTGSVNGLGKAQKKVIELQNQSRIAQLKAQNAAIEAQKAAISYQNQQTMQNAGPSTAGVLGRWAANTVGVLAGGDYKSMNEIAEGANGFDEARRQVQINNQQVAALDAQTKANEDQIAAIEAGQSWQEAAGREGEEAKKQPVGTNTRAGSLVERQKTMQSEIEAAEQAYQALVTQRIEELRERGYSEEEAAKIAEEEHKADKEATEAKIEAIKKSYSDRESDILAGGADITKRAEDLDKSDLEKELDSIEQQYIDARKKMIEGLVSLGHTQDEAEQMADEHLKAERAATDRLKEEAIQREAAAKAQEEAEEIARQAAEAKKAEIEAARAYVDDIEAGLNASERQYSSSGGTFSAFDELDTRNIAAESLDVEKQQLKQQKDMVERMRELIDLYEQTDTTSAVFA